MCPVSRFTDVSIIMAAYGEKCFSGHRGICSYNITSDHSGEKTPQKHGSTTAALILSSSTDPSLSIEPKNAQVAKNVLMSENSY